MDNKSFFDKNAIFTITNRQNIDNEMFYWRKNKKTNKKVLFRVIREEIYALTANLSQKHFQSKKKNFDHKKKNFAQKNVLNIKEQQS